MSPTTTTNATEAPLINAMCACCGGGMFITGDASHPTARVPGSPTSLVFCTQKCKDDWTRQPTCTWCGATNRTTLFEVKTTGSNSQYQHFCDVKHKQQYEAHTAAKVAP